MCAKTAFEQIMAAQLKMQELHSPNRDLFKNCGLNNWSTQMASSLAMGSEAQKAFDKIQGYFELISTLYSVSNSDPHEVLSHRIPYSSSQENLSVEAYDLAQDVITQYESSESLIDNPCLVSAKEDLKREKEDNTLSPLQKVLDFIIIASFVILCGTTASDQIDSMKIQNSLDTIIQIEQSENEQNNRQQVSLDKIVDLLERQNKILEENKEQQNYN